MFKVKLVNFEHTSHLALAFLIVDFQEAMPPGSFHSNGNYGNYGQIAQRRI